MNDLLKAEIVALARQKLAEFTTEEEQIGNCLFQTVAVIIAAREHGLDLVLYAGSAHWPVDATGTFGFEWDPEHPVSQLRLIQGALPEMHVWAGDPRAQEIVDISTAHWRAYFDRTCAQVEGWVWTAPDPPAFLWCRPEALPPRVDYRPDRLAA